MPFLTSSRRGRCRRPTTWTSWALVTVVLVTAAVAAWASGAQADLAQRAATTFDQRHHSQVLRDVMLATIVIALTIVSGLWWAGSVQRARVHKMANTDGLTGLLNRTAFAQRCTAALAAAPADQLGQIGQRGPLGYLGWLGEHEITVVVIDLDGFKHVNDQHGHHAGDLLLIELARRLRDLLMCEDVAARLGGDEFAVLLSGATHLGERLADQLLDAFEEPFLIEGSLCPVSASIGIATADDHESYDTVLRHADMAMYEAKHRGKNQVVRYDHGLGRELHERVALVRALRAAITNRELRLVYQPVVNLRTGDILGVEALCRWTRDGVPIPPDVFIPAAEQSGLIDELGDLVLDLLVEDAPRIIPVIGASLNLAANISPQQLRSPGFVSKAKQVMAAVRPLGFVLEITERDFVDDDPVCLAAMRHLNECGVPFAIDDFGIGYSSLGYLQHLPVRILKIDKSFAATIDSDERACNLLRSIRQLAQAVDLDVVVEGVERLGQVEHLIEHCAVPYGQGYLLHPPMPVDQLVEVLRANRRTPSLLEV